MTTRLFTALVFLTWLATVVAMVILITAIAHGAEMGYCKVYANRMSAMALQRLIGVPFIDTSTGRFLYRKAYSSCLNSDEEPPITLSNEQQPLMDGMPTPPERPLPGSMPATDPADAPADVPVVPVVPKAKAKAKAKPKAVTAAGADQPLCTSHGKKTVYTGRHWRCL